MVRIETIEELNNEYETQTIVDAIKTHHKNIVSHAIKLSYADEQDIVQSIVTAIETEKILMKILRNNDNKKKQYFTCRYCGRKDTDGEKVFLCEKQCRRNI